MTRERRIDMAPGEILDINAPSGMRVTYPAGKQSPKRIVTRDLGEWVEEPPTTEPPPVVEPPPVEPPPVTEPPPVIEPVPTGAKVISPTGSDSGTGSEANPWKSLTKFYGQAGPGSTLVCRGGAYTSNPSADLLGKASGTASAPITVKAWPGEVPNFVSQAMYLDGVAYHVLDGLTFSGKTAGSSCAIWLGSGKSAVGANPAHHITIRRCDISKGAGSVVTHHGIYLSWKLNDVLIEDNTITGVGPSLPEDRCAGVHIYHAPTAFNVTVRRNIFRKWPKGIVQWDEGGTMIATGTFTHNTFQQCDFNMDMRYHAEITVRDNVGGPHITAGLYDPNHSSKTTQDHNYWNQALNADGSLQAGSPAINGASDGSDAGAVPHP